MVCSDGGNCGVSGEVGGDGVVMLVLAGMVRVVVVMAGDLRMEKQMR